MPLTDLIGTRRSLRFAREVKSLLADRLRINQVDGQGVDEITVYRERGVMVSDAGYEERFALFWIFDGFMKHEDLVFDAALKGQP